MDRVACGKSVAGGGVSSAAVTTDGTLITWGSGGKVFIKRYSLKGIH